MRSTFRLMGVADYITIANGLLGTLAILFLMLAVEDMSQPWFSGGVKADYIWAAMLCIFLSCIGDIIDGPIARRYSKRQLLGGSLDIMSDCISFCVAPALMIFTMFSRWGEASPIWTISLAIACCWMIACGMLRLARFQHDEGGYLPYFHGLSSPANALLLISAAGLIWMQPSSGIGPDLSEWNCNICFGEGKKPYLDFIIFPLLIISGGLMISDRKMSKLKHGIPLKLSILQMLSLLLAILISLSVTQKGDYGIDSIDNSVNSIIFLLFCSSLILNLVYIIGGPRLIGPVSDSSEE
jgi:phosphatidylserine synthase